MKHDIKNHVPPARFSRRDPDPKIPFSDDTPDNRTVFWFLVWAVVGLIVWAAIMAPFWL
jgi:hypothetical protein